MDGGCFNCKYFVWWDGDYCCLSDWSILVPSKKGDLDISFKNKMIERSLACKNYIFSERANSIYKNIFYETNSKEETG